MRFKRILFVLGIVILAVGIFRVNDRLKTYSDMKKRVKVSDLGVEPTAVTQKSCPYEGEWLELDFEGQFTNIKIPSKDIISKDRLQDEQIIFYLLKYKNYEIRLFSFKLSQQEKVVFTESFEKMDKSLKVKEFDLFDVLLADSSKWSNHIELLKYKPIVSMQGKSYFFKSEKGSAMYFSSQGGAMANRGDIHLNADDSILEVYSVFDYADKAARAECLAKVRQIIENILW